MDKLARNIMFDLGQELISRSMRDDGISTNMRDQMATLDTNKLNRSGVALPPRAVLYGMSNQDLLDVIELFCSWYSAQQERRERERGQYTFMEMIANSERVYGSFEGIENSFVRTVNTLSQLQKKDS